MKKLWMIVLALLLASSAGAQYDVNTDSFGVYFDTSNQFPCRDINYVFAPFPVYLVLMNPSGPVNGFECTVTRTGTAGHFVLSTTLQGVGALDVDASENGFMVGCAQNYPVVSGGLTLVTWSIMTTGPGGLYFFIGPATIPSLTGGRPVVTGNGVLRRCTTYSGNVNVPVASYGYGCVTPTETASFGSVKSLFR